MSESLYQRLGATEGITQIASDIVDFHLTNTAVSTRFAGKDVNRLKHGAATFIVSGTGGPDVYQGKEMLATHQGMNISALEFTSVLDDILKALDKNQIGQREQEEVLFILYSMRSAIILV